jgi:tetratricopeptide (TPR) repeat protein
LGDYEQSIFYAEKMVASNQKHHILAGLLNKARSEFMLGDYDAFCKTREKYSAFLEAQTNMNSKLKVTYQKIGDLIALMSAILSDDTENINKLRNAVEPWTQSVGCKGFIDYVKGMAANKVGDKQEAIYRFKTVSEICPKTIFGQKANEFLKEME